MWPCILNMKWHVRPTICNKLCFINNPLAQHVSDIIMPIFRSARPCVTAYGIQQLDLLPGVLGSQKVGRVHCIEDVIQITSFTLCTRPAFWLPKTPASTSSCWIPYAVTYGLVLLKMGIMMPETCWANGLLIKHNLLHLVGLTCHVIPKGSILLRN